MVGSKGQGGKEKRPDRERDEFVCMITVSYPVQRLVLLLFGV